jgi:hypothetical protein
VEREEDEDTQEITYTAEVGKIPDDGAAGASGGKMLLMAAHPQLAQDVRAAFAGGAVGLIWGMTLCWSSKWRTSATGCMGALLSPADTPGVPRLRWLGKGRIVRTEYASAVGRFFTMA